MILGGSTNATMHLIAMARSVGVPLTLDDFQKFADQTPFLANLKPSGQYLMQDLHAIGGVPAVMKYMLENNHLDGDCLTITGNSLKDNLSNIKFGIPKYQDRIITEYINNYD